MAIVAGAIDEIKIINLYPSFDKITNNIHLAIAADATATSPAGK